MLKNAEMNNVEVEMVECDVCGALIPESDSIETSDCDHVCEDCVKRDYVQCNNCGEWIPKDDAKEGADGEMYCEDCFDNDFVVCEHCGKVEYRDDAVCVYDDSNMRYADIELWCENCADNDAYKCDECGKYFRYSNDVETDDNGNCVCNSCYEDYNYRHCENCGALLPEHSQYWDDDGEYCYCEGCLPDEDSNVIHGYHSNIRPLNWHGGYISQRRTTLFMGWELEIDRNSYSGNTEYDAERIVDAAGYDIDDSIVCEHDGSLNYGFELISSTATLDYHLHKYGVKALMDEALDRGYTSHDAGTCGLHVHVDREYFRDAMENPEYTASIILVNNAEWLKKFSRREKFSYCEFPQNVEPFCPEDFKPNVPEELHTRDVMEELETMCNAWHNHYHALNFAGHSTIEFRFNRGTLNFETFCATMQLIQMYADAMKHSRLDKACKVNLEWFKRVAKRRGYTEFLAYLKRRNIQ